MKFYLPTIASIVIFLVALVLPFEKDSYAVVPVWAKLFTGIWFVLTGQSNVWLMFPLLSCAWGFHLGRLPKVALVFGVSGLLLALPYLKQPIVSYGWVDSGKTLQQVPQIGYYLVLASLVLQILASIVETFKQFSEANDRPNSASTSPREQDRSNVNIKALVLLVLGCGVGVLALVSAPSVMKKGVQVAIKSQEPVPLPPSKDRDELFRQTISPHHYQALNDIPHGVPGTVPPGLTLTAAGSRLTIQNISKGGLEVEVWYTHRSETGEFLTCPLVIMTQGDRPRWDPTARVSPNQSVDFIDDYARVISRGQCNQSLEAVKLEFIVIADSVNTKPYSFVSSTLFAPAVPPNAKWLAPYTYTQFLGVEKSIESIRDFAKRELQIRRINQPWAMNQLNSAKSNDMKEQDDIKKIEHAPAGKLPNWLSLKRYENVITIENSGDAPIRLRLWYSIEKPGNEKIICELGTKGTNGYKLVSEIVKPNESTKFDQLIVHPLLLQDCQRAFPNALFELSAFDPNSNKDIGKFKFISDGAFAPEPPPLATKILHF